MVLLYVKRNKNTLQLSQEEIEKPKRRIKNETNQRFRNIKRIYKRL